MDMHASSMGLGSCCGLQRLVMVQENRCHQTPPHGCSPAVCTWRHTTVLGGQHPDCLPDTSGMSGAAVAARICPVRNRRPYGRERPGQGQRGFISIESRRKQRRSDGPCCRRTEEAGGDPVIRGSGCGLAKPSALEPFVRNGPAATMRPRSCPICWTRATLLLGANDGQPLPVTNTSPTAGALSRPSGNHRMDFWLIMAPAVSKETLKSLADQMPRPKMAERLPESPPAPPPPKTAPGGLETGVRECVATGWRLAVGDSQFVAWVGIALTRVDLRRSAHFTALTTQITTVYNMQTVSTMGTRCVLVADSVYRPHGCYLLSPSAHATRESVIRQQTLRMRRKWTPTCGQHHSNTGTHMAGPIVPQETK